MSKFVGWAAVALLAAGCTEVGVSRNAPLPIAPIGVETAAPIVQNLTFDLQSVQVVVPASLRVSESNSYYPTNVEIVWRGDPIGDRHAQIAEIFETAGARAAAADTTGDVPVIAQIQLTRFHGVTERTRYSVGGVYNMQFLITLRHAQTGDILVGPYPAVADLAAPGGNAAVQLDRIGQTEKVRVTDFLSQWLATQLDASVPL
ncbi:MAG: hypothetical protein JKX69_15625 [Rhodobacteraceae bacterium]|nr:hypothetical protein [Paracoccaceae bacterium]